MSQGQSTLIEILLGVIEFQGGVKFTLLISLSDDVLVCLEEENSNRKGAAVLNFCSCK